MADVRLVTFNGETVTPQDDAILYQTATIDGIYSNAEFTISGATTIHVGATFAIIGGRFIEIGEQDINVPLAASSSDLKGQLYLNLDLQNTEAPLDLLVETAATESALTPMTQDVDLNVDNGIYMMRLALFGVSNTTIYNLEDRTSSNIPVACATLPKSANFSNKNMAPIEGRISNNRYYPGDLLVYNAQLYKATTNIFVNDALEEGTNIAATTISANLMKEETLKSLFKTKTFTTTAGSTAPYKWSINARLEGYTIVNFTVMPAYSSSRMTNAEGITGTTIDGFSSAAGTVVNLLVLYIKEGYVTAA